MSTTSTTQMIEAFRLEAGAPLFFASNFKTGPRNIHTSELVEIDIIREDEDIAVPVPNITAGYRNNERTKYVNKGFEPAVIKEQLTVVVWEQLKRQAGMNPFESPDFAAAVGEQTLSGIRVVSKKIRRTCELMSAQVMQTGAITIPDSAGATIYSLDFGVRATHKVTTTAWAADGSTGDPLGDIGALSHVIRKDGKRRPGRLAFGNGAMKRFLKNAAVQAQLDKTKLNLGALDPANRSEDATFYGMVWIENYQYELWLYDAYYKHPQTGTLTPYLADNKMVMWSPNARLDMSFGRIPKMAEPEGRAARFLPSRMSIPEIGIDLQSYAYFTPDGDNLVINLSARPLAIPTELDSFGCLTVF
jgi:hypothetical protein